MFLRESLITVLTDPTADGLWTLRADLLEAGTPQCARIWEVIDRYRDFLDQLSSSMTSRHYSDLASRLDIGSVSGVILERLLEPQSGRELALSLLTGALSEGLMVAATRQHVKAWEQGIATYIKSTAWFLYEEVWRWADEMKPDLSAAERRRQLDNLFELVHNPEVDTVCKAVLLGLLFQLLLASRACDVIAQLSPAKAKIDS